MWLLCTSISQKTDKSKTGLVLAGLNPPRTNWELGNTNFTEELFHTELFQVYFKQNLHFPLLSVLQNFASFMIMRWTDLVTDWVS